MPVLPENVNNDNADFLFQQKLYVGTEENQFEVRKRFIENEQKIADAKSAADAVTGSASGLTNRVAAVETAQQSLSSGFSALATSQSGQNQSLTEHIGNGNIHVSETLRNHPADTAVHVPAGGTPEKVLSATPGGTPSWKIFTDLLPQKIKDILASGGVVYLTTPTI
jgi:hypothetical protein